MRNKINEKNEQKFNKKFLYCNKYLRVGYFYSYNFIL